MKKRAFALILALVLCLGLVVPGWAADVSELGTSARQAYHTVLTSQINQYGIMSDVNSSVGGSGLEYAALEDMDGDGSPELIVIRYASESSAYICVWAMQNGKAIQTVNEEISAGGVYTEARIFLVRHAGRVAVCDSYRWYDRESIGSDGDGEWLVYTIHSADGTTEEFRAEEKSERESTQAAFEQAWTADSLQFSGGLGLWLHEEDAAQAVRQLQVELAVQEEITYSAGGYGPYTFADKNGNVISCSSAKVENKTVQIRMRTVLIGGEVEMGPYQLEEVTQVTLEPGSRVTFSAADVEESGLNISNPLAPNGNDRYTHHYEDTTQYWLDEETLTDDLKQNAVLIEGRDTSYLVIYENVLNPDISFTDVSGSAYYADAVRWAVVNDITTGTTATTFSPNSTCTVAQITTFLYRANGSPTAAPGGFYDDVKYTDWYVDAANWAYAEGLSVGHFGGNDPCTRAMAVTYLWILAGRPKAAPSNFTDVPDGTFYTDAVAWAVQEGITSGTSASTFSPNNTCTRAQIVTFLYRAMA